MHFPSSMLSNDGWRWTIPTHWHYETYWNIINHHGGWSVKVQQPSMEWGAHGARSAGPEVLFRLGFGMLELCLLLASAISIIRQMVRQHGIAKEDGLWTCCIILFQHLYQPGRNAGSGISAKSRDTTSAMQLTWRLRVGIGRLLAECEHANAVYIHRCAWLLWSILVYIGLRTYI